MHIVLIGYRGTGKTAVGKTLAERLELPFYDTDELIEQTDERSIRCIIEEKGWGYFRKRESDVIRKLPVLQEGIVATGGGAVMDEDNCHILKKHGLLIWLKADVVTMVERIRADISSKDRRPAFLHDDTLRETEDTIKQRTPVYRALADCSIETTGKNIDEIVAVICQFLEGTNKYTKKESTCQEIP